MARPTARSTSSSTLALLTALTLLLALVPTAPAGALARPSDDRAEFIEGRFRDTSDFGDFSSPLTQSLAVLALDRAGEVDTASPAVRMLLQQQCADGGFPATFVAPNADGSAPDCAPSVDTTSFVVQALDAVGADDAVGAATAWLASQQADDGSYASPDGTNTNSTGLAAVALHLGGDAAAATKAGEWILTQQDGCAGATPGAIPFNVDSRGQEVRATTQALPGLTSSALGDLTSVGATLEVPGTGCDDAFDPIGAAAAFLAGELGEDPPAMESFPGFADVGLTIDTLWALAAAGTAGEVMGDIAAWLPEQVAGYTQGVPFDRDGATYAGATAKLALGLQVAGDDPRDANGTDLIAQLLGTQVLAPADVELSCAPASGSVAPGSEVDCELGQLIPRETVAVTVTTNPVLLDEVVAADDAGDASFSFTVPADLEPGASIVVDVDGLGAPDLAGLTLTVAAAEEVDEPTDQPTSEPVADEADDVDGVDGVEAAPAEEQDIPRPTRVDSGLSPSVPTWQVLTLLLGALLLAGGVATGLRSRREPR